MTAIFEERLLIAVNAGIPVCVTQILSTSGWASVVEELTEQVVNTGGRSRFPLSLNTLLQQFQSRRGIS